MSAGDCGRRWSQPAPDRPARDRENHASQPTPRSPAAIKQSGSAGERGHTESGQPPHRKDAVASEAVPRPHHSASLAAMVGGGSIPVPGEISLAHNGVLFLDELPEFERRVLDALREPIESGKIHISRSRAKIDYPARFQLIAAMNPSPTGHYQGKHNRASPEQTLRYLGRLSGPFLDRFDLSLEIPLPPPGILSQGSQGEESSATVRQRVLAARERQMLRQNKLNAHLENREMKNCCRLRREDAVWLEQTLTQLGLSIRAWQRLLKVARTIADLAEVEEIERCHLQEALSYRAIDRMLNHLQKMMA